MYVFTDIDEDTTLDELSDHLIELYKERQDLLNLYFKDVGKLETLPWWAFLRRRTLTLSIHANIFWLLKVFIAIREIDRHIHDFEH